MSEIRVSIPAVEGRSERSTWWRNTEAMEEGRELRMDIWALEGDDSPGKMNVTVKRWWLTSRFANSASGMRWPTPGLGMIAICGMFASAINTKLREFNVIKSVLYIAFLICAIWLTTYSQCLYIASLRL